MTDKELDSIADEYLNESKKYTTRELQQHAATLFHILGDKLDSDNLSIMLRCPLEEARAILASKRHTEKQNGK